MEKKKFEFVRRPESHGEIAKLVQKLLVRGDALGVLPTPLDHLFDVARIQQITDLPDPSNGFLRSLSLRGAEVFHRAQQKIRGMADLRQRVAYIPQNDKAPRIHFAKGHELGHLVLPWHDVGPGYEDDNFSLSPEIKTLFECEANDFSAEAIFQGLRFRKIARDYFIDFNSIFHLADTHGASKQATTWRFIEEQDYAAAALHYYPSNWRTDEFGNQLLVHWKSAASEKFQIQYADLEIPESIGSTHPWAAARNSNEIVSGTDRFQCGSSGIIEVHWHAWWNQHALIVLLRRLPVFKFVSSLLSASP